LLDLGAVLRTDQVQLAIDDARRRRLVDWDELLDTLVVHARRGRNGVGTLRCLLDDHFGESAVTDSGFERLVVAALLAHGLPAPVLQHQVRIGGRVYRLDLAYPEARLAIELDGSVHLERPVWEADHARQNALILAGWTLLRFTWKDYREHTGRMVAQVRAALSRSA
jgi:very-short-patch-repair endonuclease